MKINEVNLGENKESRKKVIENHLDQQVIIQDATFGWAHATLKRREDSDFFPTQHDKETYDVTYLSGMRKERTFHYDNLKTMLVLTEI